MASLRVAKQELLSLSAFLPCSRQQVGGSVTKPVERFLQNECCVRLERENLCPSVNTLSGFCPLGTLRYGIMGDLELLHRYTEHRSEDAFRILVERHLPMVFSVAMRVLRDQQLSEEIAQDA